MSDKHVKSQRPPPRLAQKPLAQRGALLCAALSLASFACGSRSELDLGIETEGLPLGTAPPDLPSFEPLQPEPLEPFEEEVEDSECVDFTRTYSSAPPTVMLLIDQSGSMSFPFGQSTRWQVLRDAIIDPDNGLLSWLEPSANVGLMIYTSINGYQEGLACPLVTELPAQFGNADQIRETYLAAEPVEWGDTPTGDSIDQAVARLTALSEPTPKYILLVTDGDPDTCRRPDPQDGISEAIEAAERAYAQGITVRTVGVSEQIGARGLQAMANAGAGKPAWGLVYGRDAEAERPLYASTNARELAEQLKGVIGDVRTCTIELGARVRSRRALDGRLLLDGVPLEFGALDGWTFVDEDTLQIHGASCERIQGEGEQLRVRFPCDAAPEIR